MKTLKLDKVIIVKDDKNNITIIASEALKGYQLKKLLKDNEEIIEAFKSTEKVKRNRRTKKQIEIANYCNDVDNYKYFIVNLEINKINVGFEYKDDCKQDLIDNGLEKDKNFKICTYKECIKLGIDIKQTLADWKKFN